MKYVVRKTFLHYKFHKHETCYKEIKSAIVPKISKSNY